MAHPAPPSAAPLLSAIASGSKRTRGNRGYYLDDEDKGWYSVQMDATTLRASVQEQYFQADKLGDLTLVVVRKNSGSEAPLRLRVYSSVLVVHSELFERMLFGPLAKDPNLLDKPRAERVLELTEEDPAGFEMMIDFMHGCSLCLSPDTAPLVYQMADRYLVEPVRAVCRRWWFQMLAPENAVRMLMMARAINCEPLIARCHDVLRLRFHAVLYTGKGLESHVWELDFETAHELLGSDALVCVNERDVLSFVCAWASRQDSARLEQVEALMDRVRWDRVLVQPSEEEAAPLVDGSPPSLSVRTQPQEPEDDDERFKERLLAVERLCERLRREVAQFYGIPATDMRPPPLKRMRGVVTTEPVPLPYTPDDDAAPGVKMGMMLESVVRGRILRALGGVTLAGPPLKLSSQPRQHVWAHLTGWNPPPPSPQQFAGEGGLRLQLKCDSKPFVVGRGHSASLRISYTDDPPRLITRRHFVLGTRLVWKSDAIGGPVDPLSVVLKNTDDPNSDACIVATIQDASRHGTYVNSERLSKLGIPQVLKDKDRIDLVMPEFGKDFPGHPGHREPHFTFKLPPTRVVYQARAEAHVARAAAEAAAAAVAAPDATP